ncbi:PREDICTED: RELT-like protein 2 isoform X1 [Gavialis gangeticus]|uniref:RELT-like protein 2 isoform X1 n=1 Tax=Gavialis gangeticus TaxID=94835 RepID=UPI00092E8FD9|nr:PREDICTED: RELT-like protein 2 isoform X1 [Gavialis gangeticus]
MSDQNSTDDGEADPQHSLYMLFLLVLVFFIMGLVGFLICHVLKKKGYRCRTFRDELDPDNKEVLTELQANEEEELNEDTVEKIVRCIIQNEANVEALKEMLGDSEGDVHVPVPSSLCPHRNSQDGGPPHHHTVHLGSTQAPCIHCSKKKRHAVHRQGRSKEGKARMHPGETTVFSVGRFRVTHIEKKSSFQEQQDEPLPDGSKGPSPDDLECKACSGEKLQQEGPQSGIVQVDDVQIGGVQEEGYSNAPGQGQGSTDAPANLDAHKNGPEGKGASKSGSLKDVSLQNIAPKNESDQKKHEGLRVPGKQNAGDPGDRKELVKWDKRNTALQESTTQGAGNQTSEIKGAHGPQERPRADVSGNGDANRKETKMEDIGQQLLSAPGSRCQVEMQTT